MLNTNASLANKVRSRWWLAALIGLAVFALNVAYFAHVQSDDAYISYRYAKNFAAGDGLVFNRGGPPVEGYSNFLWVVLLGIAAKFGLAIPAMAQVLSLALAAITLIELALALRRLNHHGWWLVAGCVWLGANGSFAMWSVPGLETTLLSALVVLAWLLVEREEQSGRGWLSGLVFVLIALSRAEGAVFFVAAFGVRWLRQLRHRSNRSRRSDVQWTLAFVIPFGLFLLWRLSYYGYLLPNTYYAKVGNHPLILALRGSYYFFNFLTSGGGLLLMVLAIAAILFSDRSARLMHVTTWTGFYIGGFVLAGGDWMPMFRFFAPIIPLLCVFGLMGLQALQDRIGGTRSAIGFSSSVAVLIALLFVGASVQAQTITHQTDSFTTPNEAGHLIAAWLRAHSQPGDSIALVDAGILAYETDLRVIDMIGLNDAHIAHSAPHAVNPFEHGNGFAKWDTDYILSQLPTFIEVHESRADWLAGIRRTDWIGSDELINDPRFLANYDYVMIPPDTGLFMRRQS
jgi:arabinofuranosyltransferase